MDAIPEDLDANWRRRFRRNVLRWYDRHGRDLPWRETRDPYVVWVSEIMLQQTTVAAVRPYFARFLERFPDVATLAAADEADVLRRWEGLGYYSRGRNLHRAARVVVHERGGSFPDTVEELQRLPGVGRYTAGAVASFAFDRRAPIVEANTLRLYARLLGFDGDPRATAGQRLLWEFAEFVLPRTRVGDFNHALMDLGATVCRINEPACDDCPVRSCCRAFAEGRQAEIPPPKNRPEVTDVTAATFLVEHDGRYLLRRYESGERWAGLWDFPRFEVAPTAVAGDDVWPALAEELLARTGARVTIDEHLTTIRHGVTRYRIELHAFRATFVDGLPDLAWFTPAELADLPMSTTGRRLAEAIAAA